MFRDLCEPNQRRQPLSLCKNKILVTCMLTVLIANAGCGGSSSSSSPATPSAGTIALSASTYSIAEDGSSVDITVSRSGGSAGAISVDYATADGTATTSGSDYTAASGTLTWTDGDTADKTITVNITDDNQYEGDETVAIALTNNTAGSLGTSSATLTITDEDVPGTLAFSSTAVAVTETNATAQATLTVSRTGGSDGDVSVSYATTDGTAGSGDYTAIASGTLSWSHGETADKTITVDITGDTDPELSETLSVTLSNPQFVNLDSGNATATVTIDDNDSVPVSGTVSAPGASLAFNGPGLLERMLAGLFNAASADISELVSPVPSATVAVYAVDAAGDPVGSAITTGTTAGDGTFTLAAPLALTGSESSYIVRATGTSGTLDSRIASTSDLSVDPTTDATSDLIASITSDPTTISATEIGEITEAVADLLADVSISGATASDLSASLVTEVGKDEETLKVISSTSAAGQICGTVTDSGAVGIESVLVLVRDYGNWVTRAKTKTDSSGNYCLNVPITGDTDPFTGSTVSGEYIIGVINRTGNTLNSLKSASEWYTAGGGARTQFGADKITVANSTPLDIDFQLADGARISGTVTTHDSGTAENIKIEVRDYDTMVPVASAMVKADGTYRVSVAAGDYMILASNKTLLRPYATTVYTEDSAASSYDFAWEVADRVTLTAGGGKTANFTLQTGNLLSGTVLDSPSGTAVQGVRVRVDLAGTADFSATVARLRTRKDGSYRVWLKPGSYDARSRGQGPTTVDLSSGSVANTDFTAPQGTVTGVIQDGNSNPVSQAKLFLYTVDTTSPTNYIYTLVSQEISSSDGSFELYATTGAAYKLLVRMDEPTDYASVVYTSTGGTDTINGGDNISVTTGAATNLGTIVLPTQTVTGGTGALANGAGVLTGTVSTNGTTGIKGGQRIEVRASATNNTARFLTARTRGDGTYTVPLPVGNTYRVRIVSTNNDNTAITDTNTTVVDQ